VDKHVPVEGLTKTCGQFRPALLKILKSGLYLSVVKVLPKVWKDVTTRPGWQGLGKIAIHDSSHTASTPDSYLFSYIGMSP
jgi:hypothetical protein